MSLVLVPATSLVFVSPGGFWGGLELHHLHEQKVELRSDDADDKIKIKSCSSMIYSGL